VGRGALIENLTSVKPTVPVVYRICPDDYAGYHLYAAGLTQSVFLFMTLGWSSVTPSVISDPKRATLLIRSPKFHFHSYSATTIYPGTPGFSDPANQALPSA